MKHIVENIGGKLYSVIIPAYNSETTLPDCLEALDNQTLSRGSYEIIVVDDGSTDSTREKALNFRVKYIWQLNQGPAVARNRGATEAQGSILLFTDSDCIPGPTWLENMTAPFNDPLVAAVMGTKKSYQKELAARFAQHELDDRWDYMKKDCTIDTIDTAMAGLRKDVFLKAGGFDEFFRAANGEDTELSYRLVSKGHKLVFVPEGYVLHHHLITFAGYFRLKFRRSYWKMTVWQRYPDKIIHDSYTPLTIKIQAALAALLGLFIGLLWLHPMIKYAALIIVAAIIISSLPFSIKTFRRDPIVGILSPGLILIRSVVFALGSISAIMVWRIRHIGRRYLPFFKKSDESRQDKNQ
jgi:glycosyltransferase involved in cell wall biosynthesis